MKKILLIIFCVPLIFISCEDSPVSSSTNNSTMDVGYASVSGRIWKTTDSGVSWNEQSNWLGSDVKISFVN